MLTLLSKAILQHEYDQHPEEVRKAVQKFLKNEQEPCDTCEERETCMLFNIANGTHGVSLAPIAN